MSYFEDKRNRLLLAGFLTASGLLELMFFGYAMEELYSPLYPVLADLAAVAAIPVLIGFLDLRSRMGSLFVGLGCLVCAVFPAMTLSWTGPDIEEGLLSFTTAAFWLRVLRYAVLCFGSVFFGGYFKNTEKGRMLVPAAFAALSLVCALAGGGGILYSLFLAACSVLAHLVCLRTRGGDIRVKIPFILLMAVCFIASCWMLYAYSGGMLLTEEAACGFELLLIFAGMIMSFLRYRYGFYLYSLASLRMCLGYAGGWLRGDVEAGYLFGMVPFALMFLAGMLSLWKGEREEVIDKTEPAKGRAEAAPPAKSSGKGKYDD